jgi:hypothetical protein
MMVALIALFVALSGTATAALVITGANIKNGSVTGKDLKNGSVTGLDVKESSLAKVPNANKLDGLDSTQFFGGNLPRGRTLRGTYRVDGNDQGAGFDFGASAISFGWTLTAEPTVHFVAEGTTPPPECPGNGGTPQAAVGHLCVYEQTNNNADATLGNAGVGPHGAYVSASSLNDGGWRTSGTWAVTAP